MIGNVSNIISNDQEKIIAIKQAKTTLESIEENLHNKSIKISNINQEQNKLMYVIDQNTGVKFLIDNGASYSLIPKSHAGKFQEENIPMNLIAPNATLIKTFGTKKTNVKINNISYKADFIVAEVNLPILGIDFLHNNKILIDPFNNIIIDSVSNLQHKCINSIIHQTNSTTKIHLINQLKENFPTVFDTSQETARKRPNNVEHTIRLNTDYPINSRQHYYNNTISQAIREHFDKLLKQGIVSRSKSRYSSPITIVIKPDNTLRICGDYRKLNQATEMDSYPLPHLHSCVHYMYGSSVFSKIDLKQAFYQIPMRKEDIDKTAVMTCSGLFEFNYMPFGLKCASQTFQRYMDQLFSRYYNFLFVYIDDLIIF